MSLIGAALRDQERRVLDAKPREVAFDTRKRSLRRHPLPEKRFCKHCEKPLNKENKTGFCQKCGQAAWKKRYEASQLVCGWSEGPCNTKIAPWSKSGLCIKHGNLVRRRIAEKRRRALRKARAEA